MFGTDLVRCPLRCGLALVLLTLFSWTHAGGAIRFVDDDAPAGGDGLSWETAYQFLQDALNDPGNVTEVRVAGGTYLPDRSAAQPAGNGDRFATFQLVSDVRYFGGYAGIAGSDPDDRDINQYVSILTGDLLGNDGPGFINNGENSHHVVTASGTSESTILDGFLITAGHANGPNGPNLDGAGLLNLGGSPQIANCRFIGNKAATSFYPITGSSGGGIYNFEGDPSIIDCLFDGNVGGSAGGGGIYNVFSNPIIIDCVFIRNVAETNFGGPAISNFQSSPVVIGCVFRDNIADASNSSISTFSHGGAVRNQSCFMPIYYDCLFEGNQANGCAGAFYSNGFGSPFVERCVFIDNQSGLDGGAMCCNHTSTPTVRDCVFFGNQSAMSGGAIRFNNAAKVINSWFEANTASEEGGGLMLSGNGASIAANCVFVGNQALRGGGAYVSTVSAADIVNCTFNDNIATLAGGAIAGLRGSVANSILWGNTPDQVLDESAMSVEFCNVEGGWTGASNINENPLFIDPGRGNLRIGAGSPCIDSGSNDAVPSGIVTDIDAEPRFFDDPGTPDCSQWPGFCGVAPIVDMGAYEYQSNLCPADLTRDGIVNVTDLLLLLGSWGPNPGHLADLNGNDTVDVGDLLELLSAWGLC